MTTRFIVILLSLFFFQALLSSLAVVFHLYAIPLSLMPGLIGYALFFLGPVEAILLLLLGGCVVDALNANVFFVQGLLALATALATSFIKPMFGRPDFRILVAFIAATSFCYRLLFNMLILAMPELGNTAWLQLLWVPAVDGLLGAWWYYSCQRIFVLLKVEEPIDSGRLSMQGSIRYGSL